ncbi:MAG: PQQ-binding-like beta-propeller repeat protein [Marinifilaceae bacterium]|jgi:outer membrane protein assembly factor BamB|nr:PQQ-binding-like beta-propeller repeat protein [Marinifilaceae bacterium]
MKAKKQLEYKLKGVRYISSRKPIIIGDNLYVIFVYEKQASTYSSIKCFNKENFEIKWEYEQEFVINNILQTEGETLFICCMNGSLIELNKENGKKLNQFDLEISRCGHSSQMIENKIVVGGIQGNTQCTCYSLIPFKKLWEFETGGHSYTPLLVNDLVYQCTGNYIRCLNANTGALIWEDYEEESYLFNPICYKNIIIVGGNGVVNFYEASTGNFITQIKTEAGKSIYQIKEEDGNIYFGDGSGVFYACKLSIEDEELSINFLWDYESEGSIESISAIKGSHILIVNDDKKLLALDKTTGELIWKANVKAEAKTAGILVNDNQIYASVSSGYLFKFIEV